MERALFVANAAFNIPLSATTIVGNALVLVSIARTSSLISPSNVLLLGLAFTDFCVGLIVQPLYITLKFFEFINAGESLELLTAVHFYCAQYLCLVTFVNVTLLSVDRFLALYIHLRYEEIVTVKRTVILLGSLWICCAISVATGALLPKHMARFIAASIAGFAQVINTVLYYRIYRIVRRHRLQINSQAQVQSNTVPPYITSRFKRSLMTVFYIYLVFIACYLPYFVMVFFRSKLLSLVFEISWTFVYANSFLNPFLFSWRVQGVREAIKRTMCQRKPTITMWIAPTYNTTQTRGFVI